MLLEQLGLADVAGENVGALVPGYFPDPHKGVVSNRIAKALKIGPVSVYIALEGAYTHQKRHRFPRSNSFCRSRKTFGSVGGPSLALVKLFPLLSASGKRTGIIGARPPTWICSI
jgi:hypothetical protein